MKSPFFGLLNFAELLKMAKEEKNEKEIEELIDDLNDLTKQTYSLIENLLTWSRSQTGSIKYNPDDYSIKFLVENILKLNKNNAQSKGIEIKSNFHNLDDKISIDINMLQTVLRNLLSNAIKFTPLGGEIEVGSIDKQNGFIEFYVKDSGVGISEENIKKLFKIDESFSTQGTNNEKGTGIGLNLCYEFVHKNGGDIRVESQLNRGSTFYFTCQKVS